MKVQERPVATDRTEIETKWQCKGRIQDEIVYRATNTRWTPAQVYDEVKAMLPKMKLDPDSDMPSKRTVERMVLFYRDRNRFEKWSIADSPPEDAALILEVLADVILSLERKHAFTRKEAEWVLRIRKILPKVERFTAWEIARAYLIAAIRGRDTSGLDAYLAFNEWKNKNRFENYRYALERGWVDPAPSGAFEEEWESGEDRDEDSGLQSLRSQVEDIERAGPNKPEEARRRYRIQAEDAEVGKAVLDAWEKGYQRQKQLWFEWRRRGKTVLTPKDRAAWLSAWDEYSRLIDSQEEGK